jgi:hypothetical protein
MSDINDSSMVSAASIADRIAVRLSGFGATVASMNSDRPNEIVLSFADESEYTITVEKTNSSKAELEAAMAAFDAGRVAGNVLLDSPPGFDDVVYPPGFDGWDNPVPGRDD